MGVFDRGEGNYIGTFGLGPVSNIFSGNVIDLCPVGCLTSKPFRFRARVWELKQTQSTSVWDASGAKVTHWTRNGRLYRTTPPSRKYHGTYTVNEDTEEFIDNLTRFGSDFWRSASRWDETRIRIGSSLMPASRVEAIRQTASALAQARVSGGHTAVLVGARATMEEAYLAGKFARTVLGTDSIDWRTMLRTRESAAAVDFALQFADGDMADMFDALLIANGDFQYTVPTFAMRVKEWARINRLPIVMVGHKHDRYFAPHATVRLAVPPGSTAHALVMLKKIVASGPEDFRVAELAKLANTTEAEVKKAVAILSAAKKGLLLQSLEDCNGIFLEDEVPAAVALRQALPGFRYLPTLHDRNAYGHAAVGAQPGRLPADRVRTAQVWRHEAAMPANGVGAQDLLAAIESGKVTHLVVFGAEALHAYGDEGRVLAALSRLQFFALTDMFESPYAHKAHVFFAAPSNLERDGTYMDVQGNLARLAMAEQPVGGATPDWETISAIAKAMGSTGFGYRSIAEVFDEMMSLLAPDFAGSFDGLLLPGPDNDVSVRDPGGARRWTPEYNPGDFRTDGAHFRKTGPAIELSGEVDQVHPLPEGEGFVLTWGEHVQGDDYYLAFASAAKLLRTPPHVEFHAQDAADLGIEENAPVRLTLADGRSWEAAARVRIGGPTRGCLWVPAGVGPVNLRGLRALPRVTVELLPQAQPAEQELAGAVR
jgi:NADH dehydrogenase/NADH:ubiquinone oxidoreductase subunit G